MSDLAQNKILTIKISDYIIETIKNQKPDSTEQLIKIVQQKYRLSNEEIASLIIQLENANKLFYTKTNYSFHRNSSMYFFSFNSIWYWITIALAAVTTMLVFIVPENAYPFSYIRTVLGILFVMFLPGFTLVKMLYPLKVPIETSSESLDRIERFALSVGMSIVVTPIVGLLLNETTWGLLLASVTLTLLALTFVFATVAVLREYQKVKIST
jgi:hypothetical protein